MQSKYSYLLEDVDVRRWFENLAARSKVTAMVYLRTLGLYCEMNRTDPKAILKIASTKEFRDNFIDFVRSLERREPLIMYSIRVRMVIHIVGMIPCFSTHEEAGTAHDDWSIKHASR